MTMDLIFTTKFIFVFDSIIWTQIYRCLDMSNENGGVSFYDFALHLEAVIWVEGVNYPDTVIIWRSCRCTCYLLLRNWSSDCCGVLIAAKTELFPEEIFIGLNAHFLPIPYVPVIAEHVCVVYAGQFIDWTSHGTRVLTFARACDLISFRNVRALVSDIKDQPSSCILILYHYRVAPPKTAIRMIGPWNLSVGLLIFAESLAERQSFASLFGIVVAPLDVFKLHILVPISDPGLVGVLGSSLQLLGSVLHI